MVSLGGGDFSYKRGIPVVENATYGLAVGRTSLAATCHGFFFFFVITLKP
jgi:hypothetical protein